MGTGSRHPTDLSWRHSGEPALTSVGLPDPHASVSPLLSPLGPPPCRQPGHPCGQHGNGSLCAHTARAVYSHVTACRPAGVCGLDCNGDILPSLSSLSFSKQSLPQSSSEACEVFSLTRQAGRKYGEGKKSAQRISAPASLEGQGS